MLVRYKTKLEARITSTSRLELASSCARDVCVQWAVGSDGSGLGLVRPVGPVYHITFPPLIFFKVKEPMTRPPHSVQKSNNANTN